MAAVKDIGKEMVFYESVLLVVMLLFSFPSFSFPSLLGVKIEAS